MIILDFVLRDGGQKKKSYQHKVLGTIPIKGEA